MASNSLTILWILINCLSFADRLSDLLLIFFGQIRVHGEAEDAAGAIFADREIPCLVAQPLEGGLEMEWLGVIDSRWNPGFLQFRLKSGTMVFILCQRRILGPGGLKFLRKGWMCQYGIRPHLDKTQRHFWQVMQRSQCKCRYAHLPHQAFSFYALRDHGAKAAKLRHHGSLE